MKKLVDIYRPRLLNDVIGQETAVNSVRGLIKSGRLRPMVINGSLGCGKTTIARIVARLVNCEAPVNDDACGTCVSCRAMEPANDGQIRHRNVVEKNMSDTRGIDDIRSLKDLMRFMPTGGGRMRVLILDEVHMLTPQAQNALLKPLEDPPKSCLIILVTTDPSKLLPTLLSRCVNIRLNKVDKKPLRDLVRRIAKKEKFPLSDEDIQKIAEGAFGHPRNAVTILENVMNYVAGLTSGQKKEIPIEALASRAINEIIQESPEIVAFKFLEGMILGNHETAYKFVRFKVPAVAFFENALVATTNMIKYLINPSFADKSYTKYLKQIGSIMEAEKVTISELGRLVEFLMKMLERAKTYIQNEDDLVLLGVVEGIAILRSVKVAK